ncbi:hypothetical protein EK403_02545 [Hansschlegelia zhihuaiae]|uniref:Uncharacterized protein n=1 Tax=Hansschlegelia zhihuaiae TaxID=405005 RepID=A0A4Q0MMJ4_9HYPH|nr:hypothetical protein EK403_02545 [Hansschlegelia zhihuaiae]
MLCPLATTAIWLLGPYGWSFVVAAANAATVALSAVFEGVRDRPGHAAEAISISFAIVLAAAGPALVMGLSGRDGLGGGGSTAALFPGWMAVMVAPAMLVYGHAPSVSDGRLPAPVSADFLILFSAASMGVALAYAIWVELRPALRGGQDEPSPSAA